MLPAGGSRAVRLRLSAKPVTKPFDKFDQTFASRIADADEFYDRITPKSLTRRRASRPPPGAGRHVVDASSTTTSTLIAGWLSTMRIPCSGPGNGNARNAEWFHMLNSDVISMPDKWEYPWYAAWDLAFHTIVAIAGRFRLRQRAAAADAAQPILLIPTGRFPPTNGTSAT